MATEPTSAAEASQGPSAMIAGASPARRSRMIPPAMAAITPISTAEAGG